MAFEYNNLLYDIDVGDYVKIKLEQKYFVGQFCGLELHENNYDVLGNLEFPKSGIKKLMAVIRLIWQVTHIEGWASKHKGGNDKVYLTTFLPSDFIKLSDEEAMIYILESE